RRRKKRSVRQSLASSTAARRSCRGYCSSLFSSRSNKVKASAVAPAKPAMTSPLPSARTFLALALRMVVPRLTWPSPATTTLPSLRTVKIVVLCQDRSDGEGAEGGEGPSKAGVGACPEAVGSASSLMESPRRWPNPCRREADVNQVGAFPPARYGVG